MPITSASQRLVVALIRTMRSAGIQGKGQARQTFESATQKALTPGLSHGRFWVCA